MTNARFSDYVTSGAFDLKLTRRQIERLADMAKNCAAYLYWDNTANALMRKGLVEEIAAPSPHDEAGRQGKLTAAGLLAVSLLAEAGLVPAELGDAGSLERDRLVSELEKRRVVECEARIMAQSAVARLQDAELRIEQLQAKIEGKKKIPFRSNRRDPRPEMPAEKLEDFVRNSDASFGFEEINV